MKRFTLSVICGGCTVLGCTPDGDSISETAGSPAAARGVPWRAPSGPCTLDAEDATHLLVTTTDFATGSVAVIDTHARTVRTDLAFSTPDAVPFVDGERGYILHRYAYDFVDILDGTNDWRHVAQVPLAVPDHGSLNPHTLAFSTSGLAYASLFAAPQVLVLDFARAPDEVILDAIDLSPFADADDNPEASVAAVCADVLYVGVQRLDPSFRRLGPDALVAYDLQAQAFMDANPGNAGAQALELSGEWLRQLRRDPADPAGQTLLALTTGIERVDLATGTVSWAVSPERFAAAGIDTRFLPVSFALAADGKRAYVAAYTADFSEVVLHEVGLDDRDPQIPVAFADGFDAVEKTLERIGSQLWFGSTREGEDGFWVFDASVSPPDPIDGPIRVGLPPYSVTTFRGSP